MNKELALKALQRIKNDPKSWDQGMWATRTDCGTKFCFAGHVVHLAHPDAVARFVGKGNMSCYCELDGKKTSYMDEAAKLLEVDPDETDLFDSNNSIEDLERLINNE